MHGQNNIQFTHILCGTDESSFTSTFADVFYWKKEKREKKREIAGRQ